MGTPNRLRQILGDPQMTSRRCGGASAQIRPKALKDLLKGLRAYGFGLPGGRMKNFLILGSRFNDVQRGSRV